MFILFYFGKPPVLPKASMSTSWMAPKKDPFESRINKVSGSCELPMARPWRSYFRAALLDVLLPCFEVMDGRNLLERSARLRSAKEGESSTMDKFHWISCNIWRSARTPWICSLYMIESEVCWPLDQPTRVLALLFEVDHTCIMSCSAFGTCHMSDFNAVLLLQGHLPGRGIVFDHLHRIFDHVDDIGRWVIRLRPCSVKPRFVCATTDSRLVYPCRKDVVDDPGE